MRNLLGTFLFLGFSCWAIEVNLLEVDLVGRPGARLSFSFLVRNRLPQPEMITIYLGDWDRDVTGENRFYPPGTVERTMAPWLSLATEAVVFLGPGEVREISGTVHIPSGAGPGTYWAILFVQGEPRLVPYQGVLVTVTRRIGIKIYVTIEPAEAKGMLRAVEPKGLNPLWVLVKFANVGLRNLREVRGKVRVLDVQGRELTSVPVGPFPCLPGGERWVRVDTNLRLAPGPYLIVAEVDYGGEALLVMPVRLSVRPLNLRPLEEGLGLPQDLDGDGFYEDVDGTGVFDENDVALFARQLSSALIRANLAAFDFNNDGSVDEADLLALRELLLKGK
jgi:hypothetical protein